jgi:hypothetical protein
MGVGMLGHILWRVFKGFLGFVGLTPVLLLYLVVGIVVLAFGTQLWRIITGKMTWSLIDDEQGKG